MHLPRFICYMNLFSHAALKVAWRAPSPLSSISYNWFLYWYMPPRQCPVFKCPLLDMPWKQPKLIFTIDWFFISMEIGLKFAFSQIHDEFDERPKNRTQAHLHITSYKKKTISTPRNKELTQLNMKTSQSYNFPLWRCFKYYFVSQCNGRKPTEYGCRAVKMTKASTTECIVITLMRRLNLSTSTYHR